MMEKTWANERKIKTVQEALDREIELKELVVELRHAQPE